MRPEWSRAAELKFILLPAMVSPLTAVSYFYIKMHKSQPSLMYNWGGEGRERTYLLNRCRTEKARTILYVQLPYQLCGTTFSEQTQTRACPKDQLDLYQQTTTQERHQCSTTAPCLLQEAWAGEQKSAHSHPRLPEQEKDHARAGYCVLLAAHLQFFAASH